MADLLSNKLQHSFSFNSSRNFIPFSLPLRLSPPHSNLSIVRFTSLRRTRLSHSSLHTKFSSDSSPFDIISTAEQSDGSIVFKFGDASEIPQSEESTNFDPELEASVDGEDDVNNSKIIVLGISNGEHNVRAANSEVLEISEKAEVLETSDAEHEANDAKSELLEAVESEGKVKMERESVTGEKLPELDESDSTEVENSVDKETESQDIATNSELLGLSGETEEKSTDFVDDLQSVDQANGASIEDKKDQDSVLNLETENSDDHETEGQVKEQCVEVDTAVTASDSATGLEDENSDDISHGEEVAVLSTSQLKSDKRELVETAEVSSHVDGAETTASSEISELDSTGKLVVTEGIDIDSKENAELESNGKQVVTKDDDSDELSPQADASDTTVYLEDSEHENHVKHVVTEDDGSNKHRDIAEMNSVVKASDVAVSLEHSEHESDVKDVVSEVNGSVEQMQQPALSEAEPMLLEEATNNSIDDVVAAESASETSLVNDDPSSTLVRHDDDPSSGDVLEVTSSEALGMSSADINLDSISYVEISTPTLSLSSAAASLSHQSEALAGGADAYFVCQNWFGVADGVSQWSLGGTNEGQYALELMQNCERLAINNPNAELKELKEVFQQSAAMTQSTGSARVLIAHFSNQFLDVVNIGDSGFVIIRNGTVFKKSSPMIHEFGFPYAISSGDDPLEVAEEYHINLEDGDVIITATDGLFDNLYEPEIASIVYKSMEAGMKLKDLAELLVVKSQEVGRTPSARSPFADAAQAAGHTGYNGGKPDHVTVIVSLVQTA